MTVFRTMLLPLVLLLSGCVSAGTNSQSYSAVGGCPGGSVKVCMTDSLRGCRCGELIILP